MKAVTWHGQRDVRVEEVADPRIQEPTDAIVRITSTGLCGSDLHLYEVLGPFMGQGDILGHEPMGVVEEVGGEVSTLSPGQRVVIPFQTCCGHCFMCERGLQSQCETTQVRQQGMGAALFGYTKLYGQLAGGQAEYLRVPQAHYSHIKVPDGPPDDRFVYLSDVVPTAWQAVEYASIPDQGSLVVIGLGPIGDMACRIARHRGVGTIIGLDVVPERVDRARGNGVEAFTVTNNEEVTTRVRELTNGRGADSVIDAVGMEAHGSPVGKLAQQLAAMVPDKVGAALMNKAGLDRLGALYLAIELVRRGGTLSLSGVYGGQADPLPMLTLFDKQLRVQMGQANVKRWIDDIMPLISDDADPLGVENFATHRMPLQQAPQGYEMFQKKNDGAVKVLFQP
ncbi:threonine dehydrogenase-like Zn-dependent dehydrogenase [Saccharopolyspora lacisalsi]|uniref:Threonine dehydrogenase-like Zn-dependent dehydrogenase n=1 Tax=Halosaccharopolyspora lacisalsi TaxID=1000566 RepID=A0A839DVU6_9PSEU|nr:alcohol dehydrogenase catalytic domain-containing protein [Halosaccharopolyspora lacisalsi]MBA8824889.1 threonine dehydrogenase-like Zn-dependent dehydrogenase [Halosaccharopolyspora lacisalsi]